jgi:GTP-dependent phosphoenolpyruvate carboxykinase
MPEVKDLDLGGLKLESSALDKLFEINGAEWKAEAGEIGKFYAQFGGRLPSKLVFFLEKLKKAF